jgi:hypothetical protein
MVGMGYPARRRLGGMTDAGGNGKYERENRRKCGRNI